MKRRSKTRPLSTGAAPGMAAAALPDLQEVAAHLARSAGFLALAMGAFAKGSEPRSGRRSSAGGDALGLRILVLGSRIHAPVEMLKLSPVTNASMLSRAPQEAAGKYKLRITRRWLASELSELRLGPPGGGFVFRFAGSREMCFLPCGPGGDLPSRVLLHALCSAAVAARAPVVTACSAAVTEALAPLPAPPPPPPPPPPPLQPPSHSSLPSPAALAALAAQSGLSLDEVREHCAAEARLAASRPAPPPAEEEWEPVPEELLRPEPSRRPEPRTAFARPPPAPPLDVERLLEALFADCRGLREALAEAPPAAAGDALARRCAAVSAGSLALRGLVAGHFGQSSWRPAPRGRCSLFAAEAGGRETPTSGAVAVWMSVAADAEELLAQAGCPGYAWAEAEAEEEPGPAAASVRMLARELGPAPRAAPPPQQLPPHLAGLAEVAAPPTEPPGPAWVDLLLPAADPFAQLAPPELGGAAAPATVRVPMSALRPLPPAQLTAAAAGRPLQPGSADPAASRAALCGCALCFERPVEAALLECGHAVSCERCAAALVAQGRGCPVCRAPIARVVRVYL